MRWTRLRLVAGYSILIILIVGYILISQVLKLTHSLHIDPTWVFAPLSSASHDGSVTILLLGIGGGYHEGPSLTDSINLVSYSPERNTLRSVGIPRDIWVPDIRDKINSVYTYALDQDSKDPYTYVKKVFHDVFGVNIDYILIVDFADFVKIIDSMGGIDLVVPRTFVDTRYPRDGFESAECEPYDPDYACRYETLVVRKGPQHMNGTVALKFVRSRRAEGTEGGDFSRSERQQLVISAVRSRLEKLVRDADFDTLAKAVSLLDQSITRDIPTAEVVALVRTALLSRRSLESTATILDTELFEVPDMGAYDGRYVLVPVGGDTAKLKDIMHDAISSGEVTSSPTKR